MAATQFEVIETVNNKTQKNLKQRLKDVRMEVLNGLDLTNKKAYHL